MLAPKDNFSEQSKLYKKFRPVYPRAFYDDLLELVPVKNYCWDCGTGNGQVAQALAPYFQEIQATDISANQLEQAPSLPNVHYSLQRAEQTNFPQNHFDLITVAQAAHWFQLEAFYTEVRRVMADQGVLAIWGYGLLRIAPEIDAIIDSFYQDTIGPYWDPERRHIDRAYASLGFPFEEITLNKPHAIETQMDLEGFMGYLSSWSSVRHYIHKNGEDPLIPLQLLLEKYWEKKERKTVRFPLFTKIARITR